MTFVDHFPNDHSSDHSAASTEDVPTEFNPSAEFHVNEGPRDIALVFIGDAYVAGYGDPKGLGWVSRVVGRTAHADVDITAYQLGVRDETSAEVSSRTPSWYAVMSTSACAVRPTTRETQPRPLGSPYPAT